MIRCRGCNNRLNEQVHFCNVCGLPQNPAEFVSKVSASSDQKTPTTNETNRCDNCATVLPEEAHFCATCGTAQASHESSAAENSSMNRANSVLTSENDESSNILLQPLVPQKSAQGIKQTNEQLSKEAENGSNRPQITIHASISPTQPTSKDVKSPTTIQRLNSSQPVLTSKPSAVNTTKSSNPTTTKDSATITPQFEVSDSDENESISLISTQTHADLTEPDKTPGLIRPITTKTSARSAIPSRPESVASTISMQSPKQRPQTPAYSMPVPPAKVSLSSKHKTQRHSNTTNMEQNVYSQDKQQIASLATQQIQVYSHSEINGNIAQNRTKEQNVRVQKNPVVTSWQDSSTTAIIGNNDKNYTQTMDLLSPASFVATSKAAEHWRKSWRDRQYAEAGPSEKVSRGQASVPMPLNTMQQSFVRMRAIKKTATKHQNKRSKIFGTWITIFLMICLILGLGAYIMVSFLNNSPFVLTHTTSPTNTTQPTLNVVGISSQAVKIDQLIHLHGAHFGSNHSIYFLRDAAMPIVDTNGNNIFTHTDNQGAFQATFPVDINWTTGSHSIEALDKRSSQMAFLTIQVIPEGTPSRTSTGLSVSMDGKPSKVLKFSAINGQGNPDPQRITITNISGVPLNWTATANANNNLNWLMINDNNNDGQMEVSQPHTILISVNTVGLSKKLYLGQIIFTINNTQQLTLPVQLQIIDATPEMVFSPNPIIAQIGPGNTCQPGVSMTLINLGTSAISWAVNPDDNIKGNIKFVSISNGQTLESGTLLPTGSQSPSGQPGDTIVLTLQCTNIIAGHPYHVSVYANQLSWSELVIVQ